MPRLHALVSAVTAAALAPTTLAAQPPQQTPENAQRFLSSVWPQQFSFSFPGLPVPVSATRTSEVTSVDGHCRSSFTTRLQDGDVLTGGVYWDGVIQVRQEGSQVVTVHRSMGQTTRYEFFAQDLAARVAFAMEYLRQHCDPAANTGF